MYDILVLDMGKSYGAWRYKCLDSELVSYVPQSYYNAYCLVVAVKMGLKVEYAERIE